MGLTIWKETLKPADVQEIMVSSGAKMLCARDQNEQICVWFRCDPSKAKVPRQIAIVGTGHPAPGSEARYLGTASLMGGHLIFHVFERPMKKNCCPRCNSPDLVRHPTVQFEGEVQLCEHPWHKPTAAEIRLAEARSDYPGAGGWNDYL